jgi:hypothetical protein
MTPGVISATRDSGNHPRGLLCAILRGESALPEGEERDRLIAAARAHRIDRLVASRTGQIDDGLRAAAILDELQVRELNRVLAGLESRGIKPLVLKGAALAHTHYEESWLRPRLDADLLIARSDRQRVRDALRVLGYAQLPLISGELVMSQMPFGCIDPMGMQHVLDVHWRIANPQVLADLPGYEELASRASTICVRGQPMRIACPVDALLLACVHRAAHHDLADDLLWLYDIHLIAERFGSDEWNNFAALASEHRVRALCHDGLRMAHDSFHTPIPRDVFVQMNKGRKERSAVFLKKNLTRLDKLVADLGALGLRARMRLVFEHLFPPARYISEKYGTQRRVLLPMLYLRRVIEGIGSWTRVG